MPPQVRVLSVDVFDTLLMRNEKPELMRFQEVAVQQSQFLAERGRKLKVKDLYHARVSSAHVCYQTAPCNHGERDARLIDIFRVLIESMHLTNWITVEELLYIELLYERKNLQLNQDLLDFLQKRGSGKKIVLTSDIYFREAELAWLVGEFVSCFWDNIYASCDYSMTKRGGGLFKLLCKNEGVTSAQVLHIGDNRQSDVQKPRELGLMTCYLPRPYMIKLKRLAIRMLNYHVL